jgi:transposase
MSVRKLFNRPLNSVAHVDYLRLAGIITIDVKDGDKLIEVEAEVAAPLTKCPNCGAVDTLQGDGAPSQSFWDLPNGKPRWVTLTKQDYKCKVCHQTCKHNLDFLPSPKAQITTRLVTLIILLIDLGLTYMSIAELTGPDDSTIRDIRDIRDADRALNPTFVYAEIIALDDWQQGRRKKKRVILLAPLLKANIDLFATCRSEDFTESGKLLRARDGSLRRQPDRLIVGLATELKRYLSKHPETRVVVMDMCKSFRTIFRRDHPQLLAVIDPYHVKQLLEKMMPDICDRLAQVEVTEITLSDPRQPNLFGDEGSLPISDPKRIKSTDEKRLAKRFKRYRKVSMDDPEGPVGREKACIQAWSATYPMLADILDRRDAFYRLWDSAQNTKDALAEYDIWVASLWKLGPDVAQVFAGFVATVQDWREEIFAYFDIPERPSNGFTEAMVGVVKRWIAIARYESFPVLRHKYKRYVPKSTQGRPTSLRKLAGKQRSKLVKQADKTLSASAA